MPDDIYHHYAFHSWNNCYESDDCRDFGSCDFCKTAYEIGCAFLEKMRIASEDMMYDRAKNSINKNFILSQHYQHQAHRLYANFTSMRNSNQDDIVVAVYGHVQFRIFVSSLY